MGRTKNYLRYVHDSTFGLVAASQVGASIKFLHMRDTKDRFVAVPANENVYFWDLKTKQIINKLPYDEDNAAEVTVFECYHGGHPRTNLIAVGYANGKIRVFEYETGELKAIFTGHRTAISALAFDKDGSRLASGGKDCTIVLWDTFGEKGLFSLKGHKNSISKLAFLRNEANQKDIIVSSSIDAVSTIKFWDLQTQHCFYTIPGQANGVWSFVLIKDGSRMITGSTSPELKVYSIEFLSESEAKAAIESAPIDDPELGDDLESGFSELEYGLKVKHLGNILRNSTSVSNRVEDIVVDQDETLMVCHSVDKIIELYAIRNEEDALTYAKKKAKKAARRLAKRKRIPTDDDDDDTIADLDEVPKPVTSLDSLDSQSLVDCEFNRKFGTCKLDDKVKALTLAIMAKTKGSQRYKVSVMFSSNKIECFQLKLDVENTEDLLKLQTGLANVSHRTDVRALAVSSDNSLIMSASAECLKIWRLESRSCVATIDTEYGLCCTFANAQNITADYENRFAILGTKQGHIQMIDIADTSVVQTYEVCNDGKPLNSICVLPNKTGIVCGGEDGIARFYNFTWGTIQEDGQNKTSLSLELGDTLPFNEGITCVNVSSNGALLAVALLDLTIRIHYIEKFKYFLTMYGHKLPVTTMDISDDNNLLVTGSIDKNLKIWGLDFGDCHKSIFAHDDAVTCVRFQPKTHYVFSCGRDKAIKQWDCDHFIKIQTLRKHQAEVWCMAISPNGKSIVTGSHDKSIRLYRKTEEILVPSDEEETQRELEDERNVFEKQDNIIVGETNLETGFAAKMTIETVKSTDRLIEAIDVFGNEQAKEREFKKQCEIANDRGEPKPAEPEHDPLLMTAMTTDYKRFMLETLRRIRSSELEEILLTLPFDYTKKLLIIVTLFLERRWDVELMVRCASFLLKVNFGQIAASSGLVPVINELRAVISKRSAEIRDRAGFNLIALHHLAYTK